MVIFKVGDKVRLKRNHKKKLGDRYKKSVGTVVDFQIQMSSSKQQYCRVQFSESTYDYDDLNSRYIELI